MYWHAYLKGFSMQTQSEKPQTPKKAAISLREDHVFSWRFIAVLSLMGCIAVTVLFDLLPVDHDTLALYWYLPVSLLVLSQLYFGLRFTRHFEIKLLLMFLAWGCATVVLNYGRAQLVDSYEWFATICTVIFLCFSLPYAFEKEGATRVLKMLAVVMLIAAVLLSVVSLIAVYAKEFAAKVPSIFEGITIFGGRLNIDAHPNRSAPAPALGIILAGILLASTKKVWQRVLIVLGAVVCYVPLALTCSRTAILGAALAVAFEVALTLRYTLKGKIRTALRVCISLFVAAVVLFSFYKGSEMVAQLSNTVLARQEAAEAAALPAPVATALPEQTASPAAPAATEPASTEPSEQQVAPVPSLGQEEVVARDFSDAATFNGRTQIWLGVWNGIQENPSILLIGTGPEKASEVMSPYFPPESPIGIFHNSLVGTLVSYGLPGLALALVFLVLVAVASLRLCFGKKSDHPLAVRLLPAVLLFTVIEGMMEDFLFTSLAFNIIWIWFMIAAGFVLRLDKPEANKQENA